MPVYYDGKKIIPAPKISIAKEYQKSANGDVVGSIFKVNVIGTILPDKGSPTSSGTFWTTTGYPPDSTLTADEMMKAILKKQEAMRGLFATEGRLFEIQPWDNTTSTKFNPRIISFNFQNDNPISWFNKCEYTIDMECDVMYGPLYPDGEDIISPKVTEVEENWQIEFNDQYQDVGVPTYRMTHSLSATGKKFYLSDGTLPKTAWQQARTWVQSRLRLDATIMSSSGALNVPSNYGGYNHSRNENIDERAGRYAITENWILSPSNALEDFTIETKESMDDGIVRVTINGTITGLESRNPTTFSITQTKWAAASGKFATVSSLLLTRAQTYSGQSLNPLPSVKSVGRNPLTGVINYNYEYDTRPSNCIAGARSESITVTDSYPKDIFAIIPVLGRTAGPVIQSISTVSESTRTINIECVMPAQAGCSDFITGKPKAEADVIVAAAKPADSYVNADEESWNPKTGRYTRTVGWTY
jgi:hypothetical protein